MTNPASSKVDDDNELLAACDKVTLKKPDPIVSMGNSRKEYIFFVILIVEVASLDFPFELIKNQLSESKIIFHS
jgi:hypothetical protein